MWIDPELIVVDNAMLLSIDVSECVYPVENHLVIDQLLIESPLMHHRHQAILSSSSRKKIK